MNPEYASRTRRLLLAGALSTLSVVAGKAQVEQNANYALDAAARGYVFETGRIVLADDSAKLRDDPEVQRAYLGT